jgi:hypothetical protein
LPEKTASFVLLHPAFLKRHSVPRERRIEV